MEVVEAERRRLAELREEQRRLRQQDRLDNIERMMRAKDFHNAELKEKFAAEDAREAARRAGKKALVENHKLASLASTRQKQALVDKLAKARGADDLMKLSRELADAMPPSTPSSSMPPTPVRPDSARTVPHPPTAPAPPTSRPNTARAHLA